MFLSVLYLVLAILGLGFLVFIHELGHYFMARRTGMRVESFGIGLGAPIYSFERDGVKWQISWIPFGGFVKIAGMEKENGKEPLEIPDGFFSSSPWNRFKVTIAGPLTNIAFALLVFCLIWLCGGRDKNFSEVTHKIGWLDPKSDLYHHGIRPGDSILSYDGKVLRSSKDHLQAAMMTGGNLHVEGMKSSLVHGYREPFSFNIKPYPNPHYIDDGILTTGVLAPASYIIYDKLNDQNENPLPKGSPMVNSGLRYGDRIIWVDGEMIYSLSQLSYILNDGRSLVTIKRGQDILLRRVPRIQLGELKLDWEHREELMDWQYEANLRSKKLNQLYFIPYNLSADCVVESHLPFIDVEKRALFSKEFFSSLEEPLKPHDRIIALDGLPIKHAAELFKELQQKYVNIIVQTTPSGKGKKELWTEADTVFDEEVNIDDLQSIINTIGTAKVNSSQGELRLLNRVMPISRSELYKALLKEDSLVDEIKEEKKEIKSINDPEKKERALKMLEAHENQLMIGLPHVQDRQVTYNPQPLQMFGEVVVEVWHTLSSLLGGYLSPKWISGPIGIVQVMQHGWTLGIKEAFYWLATISLNLGILNMMPLPVLDGGYIVLSIFEMITGRRLNPKTIERIIIPFAILLIGFFIFLTYNDLGRLFSSLFTK